MTHPTITTLATARASAHPLAFPSLDAARAALEAAITADASARSSLAAAEALGAEIARLTYAAEGAAGFPSTPWAGTRELPPLGAEGERGGWTVEAPGGGEGARLSRPVVLPHAPGVYDARSSGGSRVSPGALAHVGAVVIVDASPSGSPGAPLWRVTLTHGGGAVSDAAAPGGVAILPPPPRPATPADAGPVALVRVPSHAPAEGEAWTLRPFGGVTAPDHRHRALAALAACRATHTGAAFRGLLASALDATRGGGAVDLDGPRAAVNSAAVALANAVARAEAVAAASTRPP